MGLIQQFKNKTLFLDTAPIIYYIEENQQYIEQLDNLFNANNNINLAKQYQSILCNSKTL